MWTALDLEENLLQQKSRASWLATGDKNTKFFSNVVKGRWNQNKILSIEDSTGNLVHGQEAVELASVDYFQNLLCPNIPEVSLRILDHESFFSKKVSLPYAASLTTPISDDEIFGVLKSMKLNKSPGPDGFNVNFFLHCWDIVGPDFLRAVKFFFSTCHA